MLCIARRWSAQSLLRSGGQEGGRALVPHRQPGGGPGSVRRRFQVSRPAQPAAPPEGDGVSLRVTYSGVWGWIATFPKRRPFATNLILATAKTSLADIVVQKSEGKDIDWRRNSVFSVFGLAYLGVAQWLIYVTVFTRLCPHAIRFSNLSWAEKMKDRAGQIDLLKQIAYDNFIHYTFIYFPVFYMFKELIQAGEAKAEDPLPKRALAKYWNNCVKDNIFMWSMFGPGDLLIFTCPIWMRLPLNHGLGTLWSMILSSLRGNSE